jgi:hypothetical protein
LTWGLSLLALNLKSNKEASIEKPPPILGESQLNDEFFPYLNFIKNYVHIAFDAMIPKLEYEKT